jgi:hypothetical protein
MWLLGDRGDPAEALLARGYLEELLSAEEARKAAGRLGGKSTAAYRDQDKNYKDLKAEIFGRFPGVTHEDLGRWRLNGLTLAKPGQAVTWMYALLEKGAGSTVTGKMSEGIYDYLSNVTHPTLYPTRDLREWVPSPDHPDELVAILQVETDFVERQTVAAVLAFYNAMSYVTSFFGWTTEVHDQLTEAVDRLLPSALRDPD